MKLLYRCSLFFFLISIMSCNNTAEESLDGSLARAPNDVQRYGMVIELKKNKVEEYKKLHANAWPGVLEQITKSNIQNYSIFMYKIEGKYYLFSYFEYVGDNFKKDMEKMAADSVTQEWWKLTDSYQIPLDSRQEGEWWATMKEVFHHD